VTMQRLATKGQEDDVGQRREARAHAHSRKRAAHGQLQASGARLQQSMGARLSVEEGQEELGKDNNRGLAQARRRRITYRRADRSGWQSRDF
jgi:hypothetical protein